MSELMTGVPRSARLATPGEGGGNRIAALDGIRGLAIALVVACHYFSVLRTSTTDPLIGAVKRAFSFGWMGVDIFFVLSGFLIGGIILRQGERKDFLVTFYMRRAARLLPLYVTLVLFYALFARLLLATDTVAGEWLVIGSGKVLPAWSYLLYVQNLFMASWSHWGGHSIAPTWSLAVEEQFYLLAPALILGVPRRRLPTVLIGLICLSPMVRIVLLAQTHSWIPGYVLLPARWDALFIGILGAVAVNSSVSSRWLKDNPTTIARVAAVLAVAVFALLSTSDMSTVAMAAGGFTLLALFGLSLIALSLYVPESICARAMRARPLVELGRISYGVYLLHQLMHGLVCMVYDGREPTLFDGTDALIALVAIVLSIVIARLSWIWFELPVLARARTFAPRPAEAAA